MLDNLNQRVELKVHRIYTVFFFFSRGQVKLKFDLINAFQNKVLFLDGDLLNF